MLVGGLKTEICVLVLSVRAKLSSAFITQMPEVVSILPV